jgi:hypothetical protein
LELNREHLLFRVEPRISYVSDDFAEADPEFWRESRPARSSSRTISAGVLVVFQALQYDADANRLVEQMATGESHAEFRGEQPGVYPR